MIINIKPAVRSQTLEMAEVFRSYNDIDELLPEVSKPNYFDDIISDSLAAAVVTCDKVVRGVCICNKSQIPDACEVEKIYITQGFCKKGLGRKLLSYALREMRAQRFKSAFIWVEEDNKYAISFFEKFGFRSDGRKRRSARKSMETYEKRFCIDI